MFEPLKFDCIKVYGQLSGFPVNLTKEDNVCHTDFASLDGEALLKWVHHILREITCCLWSKYFPFTVGPIEKECNEENGRVIFSEAVAIYINSE